MKKILSVLLASLVLAAAGCGGNDTAATTTTTAAVDEAAATTTTAAEEEAVEETTTTAAEEEAVEETTTTAAEEVDAGEFGVDTLLTEDMIAFIETVETSGAPIYADYLKESSILPTAMGFAYEADLYGTGTPSKVTMEVYMSAMDKMAVKTVTDGVASDIIIKDMTTYMLSDAEKTAIYMAMDEATMAQMSESMTASVKPAFDASAATYESGTEEFNGTEYLFEKITTAEAGEIVIYADVNTKEIKYLSSGGITMEITLLSHDVDDSVYEVPADYTLVDMAALAQ